ncbi:DNA polymerase III subunit gamma and tau [Actinotalea sp. K2]|uniref:DNA polymerase III subunit gamma and tau n=1 Tax=Actinotalea sp. K2 TaxID=2939438 RepID=UPI002016F9AB|nr:DNA polymerase III subunit gamma and tau [Actinotalea sp. K2]MCL3859588.1 DNA polymerase III subunit gamma and tau [Actinotalea sp. K2]
MTTALYRRYRPETFTEVIGQEHVTDPLMQALRADRITHAYLFSGPRGCGKTTSARILARCLNCAEGPTDTPCGTCDSCTDLARGGPGSLDVVEIDAASHGGVDDARDLRERATFAPARDRFKIFILDEAHMVTPQGFNALLKIVEEPPPHVKFVFATTEPDKVIGTIRSRTHHYPFRLVAPDRLISYLEEICAAEGVPVGSGVLPLVVRAGGGSVRDSLSVLDQLVAGSGEAGIDYERAVALLGYTHATLLDDTVDAIAARDGASAFRVVDRVVSSGHEPRRFVEDLLERLRDLIVIAASGDAAQAVLRDLPADQLERMRAQATALGAAELSRSADLVNTALTEMTGATSPRLHLELLAARLLLPAADDGARGFGARLDKVERDLGQGAGPTAPTGAPVAPGVPVGTVAAPAPRSMIPLAPPQVPAPTGPQVVEPSPARPSVPPREPARVTDPVRAVAPEPEDEPAVERVPVADGEPTPTAAPAAEPVAGSAAGPTAGPTAEPVAEPTEAPVATPPAASTPSPDAALPASPSPAPRAAQHPVTSAPPSSQERSAGGLDAETVRRRWPEVLQTLRGLRMATWVLVSQNAQVAEVTADKVTLGFSTPQLATTFRAGPHQDNVQRALHETLGITVRIETSLGAVAAGAPPTPGAAPGPGTTAEVIPAAEGGTESEAAARARRVTQAAEASWDAPVPPVATTSGPSGQPDRARPTGTGAGRSPRPGVAPGAGRGTGPDGEAIPDGPEPDPEPAPEGAAEEGAGPAGARTRAGSPFERAMAAQAKPSGPVEVDDPSPDDPDLISSGLVGAPLVAQMLGGTVIDEIPDDPR